MILLISLLFWNYWHVQENDMESIAMKHAVIVNTKLVTHYLVIVVMVVNLTGKVTNVHKE
jgi:hypothetical protein